MHFPALPTYVIAPTQMLLMMMSSESMLHPAHLLHLVLVFDATHLLTSLATILLLKEKPPVCSLSFLCVVTHIISKFQV
jgi:hypothetical protein